MKNLLKRFAKDESGATAIEYGLIAALISVAIIGGAQALGGHIDDKFTKLGETLRDAGKEETKG
ncbi:components of type IV pilus, pilin subunit [Brucella endophytica]|uniref:Components of type IV pilus, pilin subunit n=1 Tax=Brucella endophytica TaxID=1963359 RepID=A0A916WDQ5_9HYPH|nr:Flp family type IVb pilin [Brucella endophytica]GGA89416.1 components of type IV pilus, pilin subunit [Brucella endophytica]